MFLPPFLKQLAKVLQFLNGVSQID